MGTVYRTINNKQDKIATKKTFEIKKVTETTELNLDEFISLLLAYKTAKDSIAETEQRIKDNIHLITF